MASCYKEKIIQLVLSGVRVSSSILLNMDTNMGSKDNEVEVLSDEISLDADGITDELLIEASQAYEKCVSNELDGDEEIIPDEVLLEASQCYEVSNFKDDIFESVPDEILLEASQAYEVKKDTSEVGGIVGKHGKRCGVPVSNETLEEV